MSTIHHLHYVKSGSGLTVPSGDVLQAKLNSMELSPGDTVRMIDGALFGRVVSNFTDFDHQNTEEFCKEIVKHEKGLALMRMIGGKLHFIQYVYCDRSIVKENGDTAYQVLGVAFGEPVWVNVDDSYRCYNRDCYDSDKAAYTHGHQLWPLVC
tara:strand:- start:572 stop:1030 length:459 start_codon:yes stop_codon:yes gene_type:complete